MQTPLPSDMYRPNIGEDQRFDTPRSKSNPRWDFLHDFWIFDSHRLSRWNFRISENRCLSGMYLQDMHRECGSLDGSSKCAPYICIPSSSVCCRCKPIWAYESRASLWPWSNAPFFKWGNFQKNRLLNRNYPAGLSFFVVNINDEPKTSFGCFWSLWGPRRPAHTPTLYHWGWYHDMKVISRYDALLELPHLQWRQKIRQIAPTSKIGNRLLTKNAYFLSLAINLLVFFLLCCSLLRVPTVPIERFKAKQLSNAGSFFVKFLITKLKKHSTLRFTRSR